MPLCVVCSGVPCTQLVQPGSSDSASGETHGHVLGVHNPDNDKSAFPPDVDRDSGQPVVLISSQVCGGDGRGSKYPHCSGPPAVRGNSSIETILCDYLVPCAPDMIRFVFSGHGRATKN
jgi:hypothetical protein